MFLRELESWSVVLFCENYTTYAMPCPSIMLGFVHQILDIGALISHKVIPTQISHTPWGSMYNLKSSLKHGHKALVGGVVCII